MERRVRPQQRHTDGHHRPGGRAVLNRTLHRAHPHPSVPSATKTYRHGADAVTPTPHANESTHLKTHKPFEAFSGFEGYANFTAAGAEGAKFGQIKNPASGEFDQAGFVGNSFAPPHIDHSKGAEAKWNSRWNSVQAALQDHDAGPKPDLVLGGVKVKWDEVVQRIRRASGDPLKQLDLANDAVNGGIRYSKAPLKNEKDFVISPLKAAQAKRGQTRVECAPIALAKGALLRDAGFDPTKMALVTIEAKGSYTNAHVVLAVKIGENPGGERTYMLDLNRSKGPGYVASKDDPRTHDKFDTLKRTPARVVPLALNVPDDLTTVGTALVKGLRSDIAETAAALDKFGKGIERGVDELFAYTLNWLKSQAAEAAIHTPKPAADSTSPKPTQKLHYAPAALAPSFMPRN